MDSITITKKLNVKRKYDVIVCGGGVAGVAAAVTAENMIFGLKTQGSSSYTTTYYSKIYNTPNEPTNTAIVNAPKNSITTFEFVTLLGGGLGGLNHAIVFE